MTVQATQTMQYEVTLRELAAPASRPLPVQYRAAKAVADLEAQYERPSTAARAAQAVRYLEPAMIPLAAAVWLYDLMLIVA